MKLWQQMREAYLEGRLDRALKEQLKLERRLEAARLWSRELALKLNAMRGVKS